MSAGKIHRLTRLMRWAARVICLIIILFGGTILIGEAVSEFLSQGSVRTSLESGTLIMIGIVALAGCILSWWRDSLSGILLVVTSLGLGVHIGLFAGRNHIIAWSILGLPQLVAGVLLIYSWWLSKHNVSKN